MNQVLWTDEWIKIMCTYSIVYIIIYIVIYIMYIPLYAGICTQWNII